jgi:hypothetical protein
MMTTDLFTTHSTADHQAVADAYAGCEDLTWEVYQEVLAASAPEFTEPSHPGYIHTDDEFDPWVSARLFDTVSF